MRDYDYGHELNRPLHYFKSLEEKHRFWNKLWNSVRNITKRGKKK